MQLHQLKPNTQRKSQKRVGRGGKRGTTSGHGTKGQRGRAGSAISPGFSGGNNRIWQLFPKKRGATSKPGNSRPHRKHRAYGYHQTKPAVLNLSDFNRFSGAVTPEMVLKEGMVTSIKKGVKILGKGTLEKKLEFDGFTFSAGAKEKAEKSGAVIK